MEEKLVESCRVSIEELFNAGFQYGHKSIKSAPQMKRYVYGVKWGISVIDLCQTAIVFNKALEFLTDVVKKDGKVLFLGTKFQAKELIKRYAIESQQWFLNKRWLGGSLTNHSATILNKIKALEEIERLEDLGSLSKYSKKEQVKILKQKQKTLDLVDGVRSMGSLPNVIIIVDATKEYIALREAKSMNIPTIVLCDTDAKNPSLATYAIPGNDDGFAAVDYFLSRCTEAILKGISLRSEKKTNEKVFVPNAEN